MSEPQFFGTVFLFMAAAIILYRIALSILRDSVAATIAAHKEILYRKDDRGLATTRYFPVFSYEYGQERHSVQYNVQIPKSDYPVGKSVRLLVSRRDPEKVILLRKPSPFLVMALTFALLGFALILFGDKLPS